MPHLLDVTMLWGATSGGVRRYVMAKKAWMRERTQWRHTVAAPGAQGEDMLSLAGLPLPFSGGYRAPWSRRDGARSIIRQSPDLIEVGDPYRLAWSSIDAARQLQVPLVGFCHSNLEAMARRTGGAGAAWAARRYLRRLYRQFDLVLAPSLSMRDELRSWGIDHAHHQPLGVDTDVFTPGSRDPAWRSSLGLSQEARVLIYAGRFGPEKNLAVLTEAVRRLGDPYVLVLIGAGPVVPKGERVLVLPFVNSPAELSRALASADVFVHAGDQETFGLAVLEALACGCPVVARAAGGLSELVDDRVGALVERGRADSFAQAIKAVFDDGLANRSQAARTRAIKHRWSSLMPGLLTQYQRLLEAA